MTRSQPPSGNPGRADPRGLAAPSGATIVSAVGRRAAGWLLWLVVALLPPVFYLAVANNLVLGTAAVIIEMVVFGGIRLALRPSPRRRPSTGPRLGPPDGPSAHR